MCELSPDEKIDRREMDARLGEPDVPKLGPTVNGLADDIGALISRTNNHLRYLDHLDDQSARQAEQIAQLRADLDRLADGVAQLATLVASL